MKYRRFTLFLYVTEDLGEKWRRVYSLGRGDTAIEIYNELAKIEHMISLGGKW